MNHVKESTYLQARKNRIRLYFRLGLGLRQLVRRPYNIILILPIIYLFIKAWRYRDNFFSLESTPELLRSIYPHILPSIIIIIPIIFFIGLIEYLGEMAARHDEAALIMAFSANALRNGHPILIKREKIKGTKDVTLREFYSCVPMHIWIDAKEEISHHLNSHFVEDIQYGGLKKNNRHRIRLYTAPGVKHPDRGDLYDDEL